MPVSNFQTLIMSCSIEPEMIQVQFKNYLFSKCLCGWVVKAVRILIVGLLLWVQYPVEAVCFCWFWNPVMSILHKNARNVRFVLFRKNSNVMLIFPRKHVLCCFRSTIGGHSLWCNDQTSLYFEWNQYYWITKFSQRLSRRFILSMDNNTTDECKCK